MHLTACMRNAGLLLLLLVGTSSPIHGQQKPVYGPPRPSPPPAKNQHAGRPQVAIQGIQPAGNARQHSGAVAAQAIGPPQGFPVNPTKRVNDMLTYWEQKTSTIKTFRTKFVRWIYDPVFGPKDGNAKTVSKGEIRYAAPDRGMIKESIIFHYDKEKAKRKEKFPFTAKKGEVGEHWVCDGKSVFEFNHAQKQLIETKLPPGMQGNAIAEGPLPFMFGAKAASIRDRNWIREIASKQDDPYVLELVPKRRGENFSSVKIHLDPKEFLPTRMDVVDLNLRSKMIYQFHDREVNSVTNKVKNFMNSFVSPKPPRGWTKVPGSTGTPVADNTRPQQARRPSNRSR